MIYFNHKRKKGYFKMEVVFVMLIGYIIASCFCGDAVTAMLLAFLAPVAVAVVWLIAIILINGIRETFM